MDQERRVVAQGWEILARPISTCQNPALRLQLKGRFWDFYRGCYGCCQSFAEQVENQEEGTLPC